nr:hypothetical protein [Paraflavitalea speifideiaquila]
MPALVNSHYEYDLFKACIECIQFKHQLLIIAITGAGSVIAGRPGFTGWMFGAVVKITSPPMSLSPRLATFPLLSNKKATASRS